MSCRYFSLILTCLLLLLSISPVHAHDILWTVSPKAITLKKGERIVGFSFKVNASIYSLPRTPTGWSIYLTNSLTEDPPWSTNLSGSIGVGAAAVSSEFFQRFVCIQMDSSFTKPESLPTCELKITVTEDFKNTRQIVLKNKDLYFEKVDGMSSLRTFVPNNKLSAEKFLAIPMHCFVGGIFETTEAWYGADELDSYSVANNVPVDRKKLEDQIRRKKLVLLSQHTHGKVIEIGESGRTCHVLIQSGPYIGERWWIPQMRLKIHKNKVQSNEM